MTVPWPEAKNPVLAFIVAICFCACSNSPPLPDSQSHDLHLNQIQVIGSHNSYKRPLYPQAKQLLQDYSAKRAFNLDYSHPGIATQLDLGLRHLELDVVLDPEGGRFSSPFIAQLRENGVFTQKETREHQLPGLKVLHVPDVDISTHCIRFINCLEQIKAWSDDNPEHLPIFILMNIKESGTRANISNKTKVLPFTAQDFSVIDAEIIQVLGKSVITPDTIRGSRETLSEAVLTDGWPKLDAALGKIIFIYDGNSRQRELYRQNHLSLRGRSMFASYQDGEDEAAMMIINKPVEEFSHIQKLVNKGYLVRTRADGGNKDGQNQNYHRVKAAFDSGAQILSTDFYPDSPQASVFDFMVSFEKQKLSRCNVLLTPPSCSVNK